MRVLLILAWCLAAESAIALPLSKAKAELLALSDDGSQALASSGSTVLLWDTSPPLLLNDSPTTGTIPTSLAVSKAARRAAIGRQDGTVEYRSVVTGRTIAMFRAHERPVTVTSFDESGHLLATGSADGEVAVWLVRNNAARARLHVAERRILAVALNDDATATTISEDVGLGLWSLDSGELLGVGPAGIVRGWIHGRAVVAISTSGELQSFKVNSPSATPVFQAVPVPFTTRPDGDLISAAGGSRSQMMVSSNGGLLWCFDPCDSPAIFDKVRSSRVTSSRDGSSYLLATEHGIHFLPERDLLLLPGVIDPKD